MEDFIWIEIPDKIKFSVGEYIDLYLNNDMIVMEKEDG